MEPTEIKLRIGKTEYHLREEDGRRLPDLVRELVCAKIGIPYYVKHGKQLDILPSYDGPSLN